MLRVLGLAVRLDHLAIDDDPGYFDLERAAVEVEQVAVSARQFTAPHARGHLQDPQREEPVLACALQERLELVDRPDLATLTGNARRVGVGDDVALGPAPLLEV